MAYRPVTDLQDPTESPLRATGLAGWPIRASPSDEGATEINLLSPGSSISTEQLTRSNKPAPVLLLVDDEPHIISAIRRLIRNDGYHVLFANSGEEALTILSQTSVDVILSDQRMPGMTGVDFFRQVKTIYPDIIRIVLSGYTELKSVTDAVNEGAIYRFLTKPWDDEQLREQIAEAFRHRALSRENIRLTGELSAANSRLRGANAQLEQLLDQQEQQIQQNGVILEIVREILYQVPVPTIGLDEKNIIAFANEAAQQLLMCDLPVLGMDAQHFFPEILRDVERTSESNKFLSSINCRQVEVVRYTMGRGTASRGQLLCIRPLDE